MGRDETRHRIRIESFAIFRIALMKGNSRGNAKVESRGVDKEEGDHRRVTNAKWWDPSSFFFSFIFSRALCRQLIWQTNLQTHFSKGRVFFSSRVQGVHPVQVGSVCSATAILAALPCHVAIWTWLDRRD